MARRSQHTLPEIKAMVLQAAETLVAEEGSKALTMRNVAFEIGYTVGSIYMVFENMNDLVLHLNARTLDALIEQFDGLPSDGPAEAIEAIAGIYLHFASRHFNCWNLIFEHRQPAGEAFPDWYREKIDQAFSRFEAEFKRLAEDRPDDQVRQAARALWGGVHGICMLSLTGKFAVAGADDMEAGVKLLVRHFLGSWRSRGMP
ncbi:TetR/AcrR family transcriptional regulator [Methylomicrobium sp. RS1]|jgi:AcrR family transcriptional regulator|uniref:TetR/AcrR family transcriptional regulator n=1 Tax=Candidatus Methylomicrobium oryzae TaxID=2802053 RepID=UPI001924B682|nr:TetR/AcrR family transcriptional regulator [Methylomicrobium sp. RS1]MBL1262400.1 TetR/AcrR family transcriptional regulator [Methylomicrobium sp. RS1]